MKNIIALLSSLFILALSTVHAAVEVPDNEYVIFYAQDMLGSPVAVSDHEGRVLWYENSEPYGESLDRVSASGEGFRDNAFEEAKTRLGYTGHESDTGSGLVYMKARYYDPGVGRFYSNDPIGVNSSNTSSFNRYLYVNNNPYIYTDPTGENLVTAIGGFLSETWEGMSQSGDGEANYEELWGAAADGYNGEGDGFADALVDDLLTFATGGALGAVTKAAKLVRVGNKVPNSASMPSGKSQLDHIFDPKKVDEGHLAPTTQSSRDRAGRMFENM